MIARRSFLILTTSSIVGIIGWIEFILIVKLWGGYAPEAIGIIAFTFSLMATFNFSTDLGFGAAHVKRISEGKDLGTCIGTFATIKIILTCLMTIIVILTINILKITSNEEFYNTTTEPIIYLFLITNIISNLLAIPITTFTGKKEFVKQVIPGFIGKIFQLIFLTLVVIAGASAGNISPTIVWPSALQSLQQLIADNAMESIAVVYIISITVNILIAMWLLRKYPFRRPSWVLFKSYFSFALPLMFLPFIGAITGSIDKLLLGYYWSSVEIGYFFAMGMIVNFASVFPSALSNVLFPTISEFHSNKNFVKIKQSIQLAERYISMITVFLIIGVVVLAIPVIKIFMSDEFLIASPILFLLAISSFIWCINGPYQSLVKGMDKPRILLKITIVTALISVALNFLIIPKDGLLSPFGIQGPTGAAVTGVLTALIWFFGLRIAAKKYAGLTILQSHTPRHIIASLGMGVVLYLLGFRTPFFSVIHWYHLIVLFGIGLIIYLGILFLLKEFDKQDFDFFVNILRPKKMLKYVKSELKDEMKKSK